MILTGRHKKAPRGGTPASRVSVRRSEQDRVLAAIPTKPAKAYVSMLLVLAGLVGIHLTTGVAQAIVMAAQLVLVGYGVWRTRNPAKGDLP